MESPPLLNPSSIISLNLSFKHLTSIEQIKQYKNLIELDLSGNNFKDPETCLKILNLFPYLKKINLAYNKLRSLPTLPKNIEILILNNNSLNSLHEKILQTPRLTTLDLSNNFVTDISMLQKLPNLKYIFLKNNKIKSFGALSILDKLQELDLEGNNIDNIEDLNAFNNHQTIKILSIRNTPLNTEQSANRNSQASLVSLPIFREGAYCRSARALKSSFTYTNMLETSNPNRSVLINKSLINSKKQVSEDDLSDEFSFDQLPNEAINDSLLGSIRSNILEGAAQGISENSTRRDRSNNLSLDMLNKGIANNNGVKLPHREKEIVKAGSSRSQEPQQNPEEQVQKKPQQQVPLLKRKNKFDMRLDLSTILKANSFDRIGFEGLSYADFQKPDTKKLEHGHHVKMEFPVPQFTSSNRSQPAETNKFPIPAPTENERANTESMKFSANQTLNSFVNQLESGRPISSYRITFQNDSLSLNEFEGLKRENQDLRKIRDELAQKMANAEKVNESLTQRTNLLQHENKGMISQIGSLEAENKRLIEVQKGLEAKLRGQNKQLQKVLNTYNEKENEGEMDLQHVEVEDYDSLLKMVQEKMKKLEELTQVDMNARILEKFDQLRNYYRKKQEKMTMVINDLESKINFQLNEKIAHLEREGSVMQTNYQTLLKKYMKLKRQGDDKKRQNATNQSNTSINANSRHPLRALNLSLEAPDTSPEIHERGKRGKMGKLEILLNPKIHFRKDGKTDDNLSKLKLENYQLRTSLEGIQRKFEMLMRENDDLKTVSNRNTHSLKMRVKELERENAKLLSTMNQRRVKLHPNAHNTSFERNCDASLKTHNMSCEDEPSYSIIEGLRHPQGKQEKEKILQGDSNLKDHVTKLKKKGETTDKELKSTKEKNTSLVKKNNLVDYVRKSNDMLNEYPQLKNLCFQFQDAVQNT